MLYTLVTMASFFLVRGWPLPRRITGVSGGGCTSGTPLPSACTTKTVASGDGAAVTGCS
jgi:hypothetical protein